MDWVYIIQIVHRLRVYNQNWFWPRPTIWICKMMKFWFKSSRRTRSKSPSSSTSPCKLIVISISMSRCASVCSWIAMNCFHNDDIMIWTHFQHILFHSFANNPFNNLLKPFLVITPPLCFYWSTKLTEYFPIFSCSLLIIIVIARLFDGSILLLPFPEELYTCIWSIFWRYRYSLSDC